MHNNFSFQVAENSLARCWKCLCNFGRNIFSFFFKSMDMTDSKVGHKRTWRCLMGFFRFFFKRAPVKQERKIYPRLELPDYDLEFEYNMNHKHRGIALIFNHEHYAKKELTQRKGTKEDEERLSTILNELNFDVKIFNDLSLERLIAELKTGEQIVKN